MTQTLPNLQAPVLDQAGRFDSSWINFFASLVGRASPAVSQALTGSPASISAPAIGSVLVMGGAVMDITLIRGRTALPTGMAGGFVPVSQGDVVQITYGGRPVVTFIPS
jgi:hypothetical protein